MLRFSALLSVVATACSGPSIAFSDLEQDLQQARCERLARCSVFPDETSCLTFFRIVPDPSLAAAIAAHKVGYDGQRARECVEATARQSCDVTARDAHVTPTVCAEMFIGTLGGGESCSLDAECRSGTCELPSLCPETGCCVGVCRSPQTQAKPGEDCAKDRDCADGLVCGKDTKCRAPGAAGASCASDHECGDGLGCIGALSTMPGTCRVLPHLGEACPYLRCADIGLRCDAVNTKTCVPVGLLGDPCPNGNECSTGMECDPATHVCREYPTIGMPCTSVCGGDSFCKLDGASVGTCVAPLANMSPCDGYNQCESFYCEQGPVFDSCRDPYICF